jgi:hypothetical protein
MSKINGLLCQHDFARILAADNIHPIIDPATIHPFWHLRQQYELQEQARIIAQEYVVRDSTVGTFFTHYETLDVVIPSAPTPRGMLPVNEYGNSDGAIIREIPADARVVQEPLNRPQLVRQQQKKRNKRTFQEILRGMAPAEDIVVAMTSTDRLMTGAEKVEAAIEAKEKKLKKENIAKKKAEAGKQEGGTKCGHCRGPGHNKQTCIYLKESQRSDILKAQASSQKISGKTPTLEIQNNISVNFPQGYPATQYITLPVSQPFHLPTAYNHPQPPQQQHVAYAPMHPMQNVATFPLRQFPQQYAPSQHFYSQSAAASSSRIAPASQGGYYTHPN